MRVLVVANDPNLVHSLDRGFQYTNYSIDLAFNRQVAKEFLATIDYDIIILDIMLPTIEGFKLLAEIKIKKPSTPMLLLTANEPIEKQSWVLDRFYDDYLPKPFPFSELLSRLRVLLQRKIAYNG